MFYKPHQTSKTYPKLQLGVHFVDCLLQKCKYFKKEKEGGTGKGRREMNIVRVIVIRRERDRER